jgi:hypothetical protein
LDRSDYHGTFEQKNGWLSGASVTTTPAHRIDKGIEVFGAWQSIPEAVVPGQKRPWFENVPRYYVPNNKGLAMVKSGTADLYALRMKGSGALFAYAMLPSPDIPEDINLIMFVIDPKYVKNGTLDGWLGFEPDRAYKTFKPGMHGSYFKPLEAYALKHQIDRDRNQLKLLMTSSMQARSAASHSIKLHRTLSRRQRVIDPGREPPSRLWRTFPTNSLRAAAWSIATSGIRMADCTPRRNSLLPRSKNRRGDPTRWWGSADFTCHSTLRLGQCLRWICCLVAIFGRKS